jgi:hypothetical protein
MTLFALGLNPLLYRLDQNLRGIFLQQNRRKTPMVAYADDVTILATSPEDIVPYGRRYTSMRRRPARC